VVVAHSQQEALPVVLRLELVHNLQAASVM
jgi:hypothetical protein